MAPLAKLDIGSPSRIQDSFAAHQPRHHLAVPFADQRGCNQQLRPCPAHCGVPKSGPLPHCLFGMQPKQERLRRTLTREMVTPSCARVVPE
jgi:hypothetical protein